MNSDSSKYFILSQINLQLENACAIGWETTVRLAINLRPVEFLETEVLGLQLAGPPFDGPHSLAHIRLPEINLANCRTFGPFCS